MMGGVLGGSVESAESTECLSESLRVEVSGEK
jgi:hypothetical protein